MDQSRSLSGGLVKAGKQNGGVVQGSNKSSANVGAHKLKGGLLRAYEPHGGMGKFDTKQYSKMLKGSKYDVVHA